MNQRLVPQVQERRTLSCLDGVRTLSTDASQIAGTTPKSGLALLPSVILAPKEAFAALRAQPTWVWALLVTIVLAAAGSFLQTGATLHAMTVSMSAQLANDPTFAGMSPEKAKEATDRAISLATAFGRFGFLFALVTMPIAALIGTVYLLIAKIVAKGEASFKQLFALYCNVLVVSAGLGNLVIGIIVALRPADSFSTITDVLAVVPSLAWAAPGASAKLATFLSAFSVFGLWGTALTAIGLIEVAKFGRTAAWVASILGLVFGGAIGAAFTK